MNKLHFQRMKNSVTLCLHLDGCDMETDWEKQEMGMQACLNSIPLTLNFDFTPSQTLNIGLISVACTC